MPRMILSPYLVLGALVASAGPVMAGASVRSANPQAPLTLHATPRIAGKLPIPDVEALFIGTLTGRGLSWRLTFHGLSNEVVSAQLLPVAANHSGAIGVKLCDPCTSGQAGTTSLSQTAVAATRRSNAYVELRSTKRPQVGIRGQIRPGAVPTLELLSPADGDTITLPTAVRFAISGYKPINGDGHIQAILREGSERIIIDLQQSKEPGLAYLPANKLLSGRRDLTFTLTTADGTPLKNAEAGATVRALTIEGGRSAGIAVSGSASGAATSSTVASGTLSTTAGSGPSERTAESSFGN